MRRALVSLWIAFLLTVVSHAKVFYFPHYADGGGWSMQFSITNLSQSQASGTLVFYDANGSTQALPIADRASTSTVPLLLLPNSTTLIKTSATSAPLRSGYARVELNQENVTGIAIFKLPNGEASVLPVGLSLRFAMFVERSAVMDTGVAFTRASARPLTLKLYDSQGILTATRSYDFTGNHQAKFVSELFNGMPSSFHGVLVMESDGEFAPVGLRFGNGILSTIGLSDLDTVETTTSSTNIAALFSPRGGIRDNIISEIKNAKSSIDVAIYSFTSDEIRAALIEAKGRGVAIRLIADSSQVNVSGGEITTLEASGFNVKRLSGSSGGLMHNKYMIVDGSNLVTGSYNWSANAEENSYENAVFVKGSTVVASYISDFSKLWSTTGTTPPTGCNPDNITVWVNSDSWVYHCPGSYWYGKTKKGYFTNQKDAQRVARPAYGKTCTC